MPFFAPTNKFKHKISQCAETWDSYGQFDAAISISNDHGDGTGEFHRRAALIWSAQVVLPGASRWEHIRAVYAVSIDVSLIGMNMSQN